MQKILDLKASPHKVIVTFIVLKSLTNHFVQIFPIMSVEINHILISVTDDTMENASMVFYKKTETQSHKNYGLLGLTFLGKSQRKLNSTLSWIAISSQTKN